MHWITSSKFHEFRFNWQWETLANQFNCFWKPSSFFALGSMPAIHVCYDRWRFVEFISISTLRIAIVGYVRTHSITGWEIPILISTLADLHSWLVIFVNRLHANWIINHFYCIIQNQSRRNISVSHNLEVNIITNICLLRL